MRVERYEAVICDLRMPGLSGVALFEQLQQAAPALAGRILVASGDLSQPDTTVFLQRTGAPALLKPYAIRDLLEAVRRMCAAAGGKRRAHPVKGATRRLVAPFTSPPSALYFHPLRLPSGAPPWPYASRPRRPPTPQAVGWWRYPVNPIEAFETLDLRVGRVLRAEVNSRARKPAYKLWIDFGPLGEKTSSAQLRARYARRSWSGAW